MIAENANLSASLPPTIRALPGAAGNENLILKAIDKKATIVMQRKRRRSWRSENAQLLSDNGSSSYYKWTEKTIYFWTKTWSASSSLPEGKSGGVLKYSKRLRQDQLILTEFESAGEPEVSRTNWKAIMIFLKTSQMLNKDQALDWNCDQTKRIGFLSLDQIRREHV